MISIKKATAEHIEELVPLFDQYRIFYKQASDKSAALHFLKERFENGECTVFIAMVNKKPAGFTLLYTSYSSVSLKAVFILNDLFVVEEYRNRGIGELLLKKAKEHCLEMSYKGLALETAVDNPAQQLYERLDWKKDTHCFHYFWTASQV